MTDLVAFLTERLDEDQELAEKAQAEPFPDKGFPRGTHVAYGLESTGLGLDYQTFALWWDPARVLAEIAAKRKRLALYAEARETLTAVLAGTPPRAFDESPATAHSYSRERIKVQQASGRFVAYEMSVRLDAMVYSDHEDFDESWRT